MPLPALVYYTTDLLKWGTGKLAKLTRTEVDNNWWTLARAIEDLGELIGPQGVGIEDVTIAGRVLTFSFSDGTTTDVTVPVASFIWLDGGWTASTPMSAMSAFLVPNDGVYVALVDHMTASVFNPGAVTGGGAAVYRKLFVVINSAAGMPYDVGIYHPGPFGGGGGILLWAMPMARDVTFPIDFEGSQCYMMEAPTADAVFSIQEDGVEIGTLTFEAGENTGFFEMATAATLTAGELLTIVGPTTSEDATAAGLTVTLVGEIA